MSGPPSRRNAFTLMELLVVIAIVAVLVGLLLPAFESVRAAGQSVKCASNLRQIGMGVLRYSQEFKGYLPPTEVPLSQWKYQRWHSLLVGTKCLPGRADDWGVLAPAPEYFRCPTDDTADPAQSVNIHFQGTSYITNGRVLPRATYYTPHRQPIRRVRFSSPSRRLLMTEKNAMVGGPVPYDGPVGLSPGGVFHGNRLISLVKARHGRGRKDPANATANVLFLDAHVSAMTYADITRPAVESLAGNLNPDPGGLWGTDQQ